MGTQLIQVVTFEDVGAGQQITLPHALNVNGRALVPDLVLRDNADFTIDAVDSDSITVTNTSGGVATLNAWLEFKHTTQRWFGAQQTAALSPNPFIPTAGATPATPVVTSVDQLATTINGRLVRNAVVTTHTVTIPAQSTAYVSVYFGFCRMGNGGGAPAATTFGPQLRADAVVIAQALNGRSDMPAGGYIDGIFSMLGTVSNATGAPVNVDLDIYWTQTAGADFYADAFDEGFPNLIIRSLICPT